MFLIFLNHFDVLMLKMIFKKSKNIINIYFSTKNYLKSNHNDTAKQIYSGVSVTSPTMDYSDQIFKDSKYNHLSLPLDT